MCPWQFQSLTMVSNVLLSDEMDRHTETLAPPPHAVTYAF